MKGKFDSLRKSHKSAVINPKMNEFHQKIKTNNNLDEEEILCVFKVSCAKFEFFKSRYL